MSGSSPVLKFEETARWGGASGTQAPSSPRQGPLSLAQPAQPQHNARNLTAQESLAGSVAVTQMAISSYDAESLVSSRSPVIDSNIQRVLPADVKMALRSEAGAEGGLVSVLRDQFSQPGPLQDASAPQRHTEAGAGVHTGGENGRTNPLESLLHTSQRVNVFYDSPRHRAPTQSSSVGESKDGGDVLSPRASKTTAQLTSQAHAPRVLFSSAKRTPLESSPRPPQGTVLGLFAAQSPSWLPRIHSGRSAWRPHHKYPNHAQTSHTDAHPRTPRSAVALDFSRFSRPALISKLSELYKQHSRLLLEVEVLRRGVRSHRDEDVLHFLEEKEEMSKTLKKMTKLLAETVEQRRALLQTLDSKKADIIHSHARIKDLTETNQDLVREKMSLESKIEKMERITTEWRMTASKREIQSREDLDKIRELNIMYDGERLENERLEQTVASLQKMTVALRASNAELTAERNSLVSDAEVRDNTLAEVTEKSLKEEQRSSRLARLTESVKCQLENVTMWREELLTRVAKLENRLRTLSRQHAHLKVDFESQTGLLQRSREQSAANQKNADKQIEHLKTQYAAQSSQLSDTERSLSESILQNKQTSEEFEKYKQDTSDELQLNHSLRESVTQLTGELKEIKEKYLAQANDLEIAQRTAKGHLETQATLKRKNETWQQEKMQYISDMTLLRAELKVSRVEVTKLRSENIRLQQQVAKLNRIIKEKDTMHTSEVTGLNAQIIQLRRELESVKGSQMSQVASHSEVRDQLEDSRERCDRLQERLNNVIAENKQTNSTLTKALSEYREASNSKDEELDRITKENRALQKETKSLKTTVESSAAKITVLSTKCENLMEQLSASKAQYMEKSLAHNDLEQRYDELSASVESLRRAKVEATEEMVRSKQRFEVARKDLEKYQEEARVATSAHENCAARREDLLNRINEMETQLLDAQEGYTRDLHSHHRVMRTKTEELRSLSQKFAQMSDEAVQLRQERDIIRASLATQSPKNES